MPFNVIAFSNSPTRARLYAISTAGAMSLDLSTLVSEVNAISSGTKINTSDSISTRFMSCRVLLSVTTMPPKKDAVASSKAPVIVTPTSTAALTPRRIVSNGSIFSPSASSVARTAAFAAALLLFSPLAMGISLLVLT